MSGVLPWADQAAQRDAMILAALADGLWESRIQPHVQPDPGGCWLWTRGRTAEGYGNLSVRRQMVYVHRVAYLKTHGGIPYGKTIDHVCRVRACCNPLHLEAVELGENILRSTSPTARNAAKTHCPQGHPISGPDAVLVPAEVRRGGRDCATCARGRQATILAAARAVGLSRRQYVAAYGGTLSVARTVINGERVAS